MASISKKCKKCKTPAPKRNKKYKVSVSVRGKRVSRIVGNITIAKEVESTLRAC